MTLNQVIKNGVGTLASAHGSPAAERSGNRVICVEIDLPARRGERRVRTEHFELTPEQYAAWSDASESNLDRLD